LRYQTAMAFRQALEERLKTRSAGDPARIARDRKCVVFDRLLARLLIVSPGRWLLKGGFALDLRLADRARTTKDVDIEWHDDEEQLLETLIDAAGRDMGDFFVFAIERTGAPPDRLGGSYRFRVSVSLAQRQFETFLLDVGFRSEEQIVSEKLATEDLLSFADIAPVQVDAVPLELQVAEKLHAYTRTYENDRPSTRVKDLVDMTLIAELSAIDASKLRDLIESTFVQRESQPVPTELPVPPAEWAPQFRRLADEVGVTNDLQAAHAEAAALLAPVLANEVKAGSWNPENRRWTVR
jgi:hypothetical protein